MRHELIEPNSFRTRMGSTMTFVTMIVTKVAKAGPIGPITTANKTVSASWRSPRQRRADEDTLLPAGDQQQHESVDRDIDEPNPTEDHEHFFGKAGLVSYDDGNDVGSEQRHRTERRTGDVTGDPSEKERRCFLTPLILGARQGGKTVS